MQRGRRMAAAALVLAACSGKTSGDPSSHGDPGNGGAGGSTSTVDAGSGGLGAGGGMGAGGWVLIDGAGGMADHTCTGETLFLEPVPQDLALVLDASAGMAAATDASPSTWSLAKTAIVDSLSKWSKQGAGPFVGVGLSTFPLLGDAEACTVSEQPDVDVAPLSTSQPSIQAALSSREPAGASALGPALEAAIVHLEARTSDRSAVVVLVTSGANDTCKPNDVPELVALAKRGAQHDPPIRTAILALGSVPDSFDEVAAAGITGKVYRMYPTQDRLDSTLTPALFETALESVATWGGCTMGIPVPTDPSRQVDMSWVTVRYVAYGAPEEDIPRMNTADDCRLNQGTGWYFDDPRRPTKILLCSGTCERTAMGRINVVLCPPVSRTP